MDIGALRLVVLGRDKNREVNKAAGNDDTGYLQPGKSRNRRAWHLSPKIVIIHHSGFNSKLFFCIFIFILNININMKSIKGKSMTQHGNEI